MKALTDRRALLPDRQVRGTGMLVVDPLVSPQLLDVVDEGVLGVRDVGLGEVANESQTLFGNGFDIRFPDTIAVQGAAARIISPAM